MPGTDSFGGKTAGHRDCDILILFKEAGVGRGNTEKLLHNKNIIKRCKNAKILSNCRITSESKDDQ